ncbi:MAG: T9SS type A sorting domain-containing protein, partial [Bacteroidetes bacterium]|nr:T9SS type A sorting domain-containing protein [Bacteroidota bacterium]
NVNVQENYLLSSGSSAFVVPTLGVYPNPSSGEFSLDMKNIQGSKIKTEVFDAAGRLVEEREFKNTSHVQSIINLNSAPVGVYYLKIDTEEKIYHLRLSKIQ